MATLHNIPLDEPTKGHIESRKCKCKPMVQEIAGGKFVYHNYMNNQDKAGDNGN